MKSGGEGRKHLSCVDHMAEQKREAEERAFEDASVPGDAQGVSYAEGPRGFMARGAARPHVSDHHMGAPGIGAPKVEPYIGGERRRHIPEGSRDHMLNHGTAEDGFRKAASRKRIDIFQGPGHGHSGAQESWAPGATSWKNDPSRLMGGSLMV